MKRLVLTIFAFALLLKVVAQQTGSFKDERDGKTYKTVKIGNQVWLAENLAYRPNNGQFWAYDNNQSNLAKYGYLYNWETAKRVCPTGWHLPSDAEWTQLTDYVGSYAAPKLQAKRGWKENGNGTDEYGFGAIPGGYYYIFYEEFKNYGFYGYWWTSSALCNLNSWNRSMNYFENIVDRGPSKKDDGMSVRCLRD